MSRVVDLWRRNEVPGWSGLYRANGEAWAIDVDGAALTHFRVGEPFDLAERLAAEPDAVSYIYEMAEASLPEQPRARGHRGPHRADVRVAGATMNRGEFG